MNEHIIQTLMEAVQQQETEVKELKSLVSQMGNLKGNAESLSADLKEVAALMKKVQADKQLLSQQITRLDQQLSRPVVHQHRHHVHKLVGISVGLFLALSVIIAGWYNTGRKLDGLRASDIKYRFLRLQQNKPLLLWIHHADSLQQARPDSMNSVVKAEESRRQQAFELMEQAARKEADAKELRRRARD